MNIQEAILNSLESKKMFTRKGLENYIRFVPTNDPYMLIMLIDVKTESRLPSRGWQPTADDLISNEWYVTDVSYQNLSLSM